MFIFDRPKTFFVLIALISAGALAMAFVAQYAFGLHPCLLCLYQRWPFGAAIVFSLLGWAGWTRTGAALAGITFAGNAALAFYHSGVERKWWPSVFEGCAVPDLGSDPNKLLETIMNAPAVRCDEIPWADPILGLSMANLNVGLCAGLALLCAAFLATRK